MKLYDPARTHAWNWGRKVVRQSRSSTCAHGGRNISTRGAPTAPCPRRTHLGIKAEPGHRDVLRATVHAEVLAASTGFDVAGVLTLQALHKARGQLCSQVRILPVRLLEVQQRDAGSQRFCRPPTPTALIQSCCHPQDAAARSCGAGSRPDPISVPAPDSCPTAGAS